MAQTPPLTDDILACIGNTPLVRINRSAEGVRTPVYGKCEFMNPGGSVKDRIGIAIIEEAERDGRLKPGGVIVEGTSGNTGIGLALSAGIKGYRCIFTIPDKMSIEKVKLLKAFGAEVIVTPTVGPDHPDYYVTVARRIAEEHEGAILANQFYNQANPLAHYRSTGPEIWQQTEGRITALVGGMGTGGTMTGCARYLKERKPTVRVIGADPVGSVLKGAKDTGKVGEGQPYKVEGIGNDKVPGTLDMELLDEIRSIGDKEAFLMTRRLTREDGLFVGGSSGLAVVAALQVARELDDPRGMVVAILPSTGERYLSKVHSDEWMQENRFLDSAVANARDLCARKPGSPGSLVAVEESHTVGQVLSLMNEHSITQVPVLQGADCVGSLKEGNLMARAIENRAVLESPVATFMEPPYPVVSGEDPSEHVMHLFTRTNEAVLVRDQGEIREILTRHDVLQYLSGR
jgi:cystathionine beta-synthase